MQPYASLRGWTNGTGPLPEAKKHNNDFNLFLFESILLLKFRKRWNIALYRLVKKEINFIGKEITAILDPLVANQKYLDPSQSQFLDTPLSVHKCNEKYGGE